MSRDSANTSEHGFTLVEVLVSAVILVIFAMAGLAMGNITVATLNQARLRAEALQGIQLDLEKIRQASLDFCRQGNSTIYGPIDGQQSCQSPFNTYAPVFQDACDRHNSDKTKQMGNLFRTYLTDILSPSPNSYQSPSGRSYTITRSIAIGSSTNPPNSPDDTTFTMQSSGRTVTITYTAVPQNSNLSLQLTSLTVTPNAVAWCPIQYV